MSKKHKQGIPKTSANVPMPEVKQPVVTRTSALDSFQNQFARIGAGTTNIMNGTEYPVTRLTRNYTLMNSLYRNSWIAKKVVNAIPDDMCKNWFSISAEMAPEMQDRFDKLQKRTLIKEKVVEGLYWGRLYGGAAALILIEGHEGQLEEGLDIQTIMPNSFKGLLILDRWSGVYPSLDLIDDICDPEFGMPMYYEIRDTMGKTVQKVHHSRIIRFTGRKLPFFEDQMEIHWGASELEHVFDELSKRDNTSWNIASLVFQANLLVNKIDGMEQMLTLGDAQAQQDFYNVKKAQNEMRNNNAMMMCGKDEDITSLQYTFSGLNDIYESFMMDIAGAAEIPVSRLFGRSPAGMNSNGDGDLKIYYEMIKQKQTTELSPKLDKLLPVMFMSEFGYVPDDLDHKYNPVNTPSDDEVADLVGKKVDSIDKVYNSGIINQRHALTELHEMSYTTNMFSSITDDDIANAKTDFIDESMLGGGLSEIEGLANQPTGGTEIPTKPDESKKTDNGPDEGPKDGGGNSILTSINNIIKSISGNGKPASK